MVFPCLKSAVRERMVDAMSNSRRFLMLLLLGTLTCVVLVQVSMDGWRLGSSFPNESISVPCSDVLKESTAGRPANSTSSVIDKNTQAMLKDLSSSSTLFSFTKTTQRVQSTHMPATEQSPRLGKRFQAKRFTLGKAAPREHPKMLVNKHDRLQQILKQGNVIRGRSTIDPMLSIKSMPLVKPERVKRIFIITYFRAGSTFFGDLLQQNWKTFYHFEPLHSMTIDSRIGDDKVPQAFNLFAGIFNCNFTELRDYMDWVRRARNQFLFARNLFLWVTCRGNPKICFNPTFVNAVCQRAPIHVIKATRLHMRHLREYLQNDPNNQTRVVYLTRDPRGIVSSRWALDWCNGTDCSDPRVLCQEMEEDVAIFDDLQKKDPSKFIKVRYEDLSLNPETETKKLFKFLNLPFTTSVKKFLKTHTVGRKADDVNPYSTRRNTTAMAFTWRERFSFPQVLAVQSSCKKVLLKLNHSLITSPAQLPYPNGKKIPIHITTPKTVIYNKNPLYLKLHSQDRINSTTHVAERDLTLPKNAKIGEHLNNTNIEIHKTYKVVESRHDKEEYERTHTVSQTVN